MGSLLGREIGGAGGGAVSACCRLVLPFRLSRCNGLQRPVKWAGRGLSLCQGRGIRIWILLEKGAGGEVPANWAGGRLFV